jgi:hypothetical protein
MSNGYRAGRCRQCGEVPGSDSGRHYCTALDNRTGFRVDDTVQVGEATGQIIHLRTSGESGSAEVYFRAGFRSYWYSTTQLVRVGS